MRIVVYLFWKVFFRLFWHCFGIYASLESFGMPRRTSWQQTNKRTNRELQHTYTGVKKTARRSAVGSRKNCLFLSFCMLLTLYSPVFIPLRATKRRTLHGLSKKATKRQIDREEKKLTRQTLQLVYSFVCLLFRMPHENVVKQMRKKNYFIHVMFLSQYAAAATTFIPSLSLIYAHFFLFLFISARLTISLFY